MCSRILRVGILSSNCTAKEINNACQKIEKLRRAVIFEDLIPNVQNQSKQASDLDTKWLVTAVDKYEACLLDPPVITRVMYSVKKVNWIASTFAGVETIIDKVNKNIPDPSFRLTKLGNVFKAQMKEYVIGHIIAHERKFYQTHDDSKIMYWNPLTKKRARRLDSLSIGILGLGDIGRDIARACNFFGMEVYGLVNNIPAVENRIPEVNAYYTVDQLSALLERVDYVCNVLPETESTKMLLSGSILQHCSERQAVFINIGRGSVCTEDDIYNALVSKQISHAILDVFPKEPLPNISRLWNNSSVTVTPHNAGVTGPDDIAEFYSLVVDRYIKNNELLYEVPWSALY